MVTSIADNIVRLRKALNLTQEGVASQLEITRSNFANYEKGRRVPSLDVLLKLAKFFNVSLDFLVFGIKENNSKPALTDNQDDDMQRELMAENIYLMETQNMLNRLLEAKEAEIELLKTQIVTQKNFIQQLENKTKH